jgi:signal transduction histidine kinase/CheY-like chemotaxis protein/HPt (histidine-containing phosphotransfer) domain-containing protein
MDPVSNVNPLPLRLMLAFSSPEYERRFVDYYVAFYFRFAQISLVLGMLLVFGDFLVDYFADPDARANFLRLELCLPILAVGLVYSLLSNARKHWQPVMAGFIVVMAYCLFWILLLIDNEGGAGLKTWVGILNFTFLEFYCFVILGVQFRYALASGALILAAFEASMWVHAGPSAGEVAYWSYHVVTLFMLAAGIGWWREYVLRKEFTARTALDEAREAAERLARIKSEFLATMSHEIRTPMNGVLGMTELLLDSGLSASQLRYARTIRSSGEALLGILNDILDFSKLEAGRVELDPIELDVRDLGEDALELLASPAQQKGLELVCRVAPDVPALARADAMRLRQILLNLLGNAVKFTQAGDVTLDIERVAGPAAASEPSHCVLRFTVCDSGIGISEEAQSRLFQAFSQADGSTTRRYGGTGLGLAVCKQLAELMGGSIGVDSAPGRGSKFWFTTPVQAIDVPGPEAGSGLGGIRAIVIDDSPAQRDAVRRQVEAMGGHCDVAADGLAGLAAMRSASAHGTPIRVALIDATLPRMSGMDLIRAVRADESLHGTAIALLTSLSGAGETASAHAAGADMILTKPLRHRELASALDRLAGRGSIETSVVLAQEENIDCMGARVLLAEDNAVNQEIARSMLETAGCDVTLADNGRLAVEQWRAQAFDLVLMDCQMPELDGLEATAAIRTAEAGTGKRVRIVALTANAMEGDRNRCLAAGMDDYLSKPFRRHELTAVLRRWIDPARKARDAGDAAVQLSEPPAPPAPAAAGHECSGPPTAPAFEAAVLQAALPAGTGLDSPLAVRLIRLFVDESAKQLARIEDAAGTRDHRALAGAAHVLKSSSAMVGACAIAAIAQRLEMMANAGQIEALSADAARLRVAREDFCRVPRIRDMILPDPADSCVTC